MKQNPSGPAQVVCVETTLVPGVHSHSYHAEIVVSNGAMFTGKGDTKCRAVAIAVRKACKAHALNSPSNLK